MDPVRFDALSRSLTDPRSRRSALAAALAGSLGLLTVARPDNAAAKKQCPPCKKRKAGKCKGKKPDGTACLGGTCQGGRCVAPAPPFCQGKDDFTDCGNGMKCSGGICATPPGCVNAACIANSQCCSGSCFCGNIDCTIPGFCFSSGPGQPCNGDGECSSGNCVGFRCQAA